MRRRSNRAAKVSPEKIVEVSPRKSRRQSKRRKQSSSESDDEPIASLIEKSEVPSQSQPEAVSSDHSKSLSVSVDGDEQIWKVAPPNPASPSGEIQKLKICLTRPLQATSQLPTTPERTNKRSPKKSVNLSESQQDDEELVIEDKPTRRSRRGRNEDSHDVDKIEVNKQKGKSKGRNKGKVDKEKFNDTDSCAEDCDNSSQSEISENVQVTIQSPHDDIAIINEPEIDNKNKPEEKPMDDIIKSSTETSEQMVVDEPAINTADSSNVQEESSDTKTTVEKNTVVNKEHIDTIKEKTTVIDQDSKTTDLISDKTDETINEKMQVEETTVKVEIIEAVRADDKSKIDNKTLSVTEEAMETSEAKNNIITVLKTESSEIMENNEANKESSKVVKQAEEKGEISNVVERTEDIKKTSKNQTEEDKKTSIVENTEKKKSEVQEKEELVEQVKQTTVISVEDKMDTSELQKKIETTKMKEKPKEKIEITKVLEKPEEKIETSKKQEKPEEENIATSTKQKKPEEKIATSTKQDKSEEKIETSTKQEKPEEKKETPKTEENPKEKIETSEIQGKPKEKIEASKKQEKPEEKIGTSTKQDKPEEKKETPKTEENPIEKIETSEIQGKPKEKIEASKKQEKPEEKIGTSTKQDKPEEKIETSKIQEKPKKKIEISETQGKSKEKIEISEIQEKVVEKIKTSEIQEKPDDNIKSSKIITKLDERKESSKIELKTPECVVRKINKTPIIIQCVDIVQPEVTPEKKELKLADEIEDKKEKTETPKEAEQKNSVEGQKPLENGEKKKHKDIVITPRKTELSNEDSTNDSTIKMDIDSEEDFQLKQSQSADTITSPGETQPETPPKPIQLALIKLPKIPRTRKWRRSPTTISEPHHPQITLETLASMYQVTCELLSEAEVNLDLVEPTKPVDRKPSRRSTPRKVTVEKRVEESPPRRVVESNSREVTVETVVEHPDDVQANIIAMNRKISIVEDTAAKLQPPPSPARNELSAVLFITNLVRPFTVKQLRELLERTGRIVEEGFWTDRIKSKCMVQYEQQDDAVATRNALHGVHWPIGNGKKLMIDYSTPEELELAKNPLPPAPPKVLPEKENKEPSKTEDMDDYQRQRLDSDRKRQEHVREWDLGKEDMGKRSRSPSLTRDDKKQRKHSRRTPSPRDISRNKSKTEEPPPPKLMDELFRKTKATPAIYWQALTPEEIALKQQQRLERMAEHRRRLEQGQGGRAAVGGAGGGLGGLGSGGLPVNVGGAGGGGGGGNYRGAHGGSRGGPFRRRYN